VRRNALQPRLVVSVTSVGIMVAMVVATIATFQDAGIQIKSHVVSPVTVRIS
jgi:hypothetical protein